MVEVLWVAGIWLFAGWLVAFIIMDGWHRQGRTIILPRDPLLALGIGLFWCAAIIALWLDWLCRELLLAFGPNR